MRPLPTYRLALAALVGAVPAALRAVDANGTSESSLEQTVKLDPFEVSADAQAEYGVTSLTGATILNTPVREIPQSVSVVTKDFLDALGAVNMDDAMIYVSGVSPRQNVPDGTVIRSFLTTRTYNDGIRNFNGSYQSDLAEFDRLEIIKGPAAAIIGTGEPGGYVNRVLKKPLDVDQGYVKFTTGSWDFYRTELDSTGPLNPDKTLLYRVVTAYQHNDTQYAEQNQERTLLAPSVTWKPFRNTEVLFEYEYQDVHDPYSYGEPYYSVGTGGTVTAPKDASFAYPRDLSQAQTFSGVNNLIQNLRVTVNQKINSILAAKVVVNDFRGDASNARTIMAGQTLVPATGDVMGAQSYNGQNDYFKTVNTQEDLVAQYNLGPVKNATLLGAEYIWNYDRTWIYTGPLPALDLFHPFNQSPPPATLTNTENQLVQTNQEGYFAQQQSKLFGDRLVLTAGIRYDRSWITNRNYLTNAFSRTNQAAEGWVNAPRVGATFAITKDLSAYGIWSQAQSPAAQVRQFPTSTTDFTIETYKTLAKLKEFGFKGDFFNGKWTVTASYFDQSQNNFSQSTFFSQGSTLVAENIIVPGALVRGIELDSVANLLPDTWLISSYTHDFQYYNAYTGVPASVVPKDKVTNYLTYRVTRKLSVNAGSLFEGPQYSVNGAQIYKHGGAWEFNAGAGYVFNRHWSANVIVQNVFNRLYVVGLVSTTSNTVMPDRNWKLTVTRKW